MFQMFKEEFSVALIVITIINFYQIPCEKTYLLSKQGVPRRKLELKRYIRFEEDFLMKQIDFRLQRGFGRTFL